jgi:DnaJ-class molecular chaperone
VERIIRSKSHFDTLNIDSAARHCVKTTKANYYESVTLRHAHVASRLTVRVAVATRLAKLVHPDRCTHPDAKQAFERLHKAYEMLQCPQQARNHSMFIKKQQKEDQSLSRCGRA